MTQVADIERLLQDMRLALDSGNIQLIPRRKNMDTLAVLGISWEDAKAEIYSLTVNEYFQGPEIDRDFQGSDPFWMFKKNINGQVIYIKFKVLYMEDGSVRLVSFHIDHM